MKLEWLITGVTAVVSPVKAEHDFWGNFGCNSAISGRFVFGEPLCDMEIPG